MNDEFCLNKRKVYLEVSRLASQSPTCLVFVCGKSCRGLLLAAQLPRGALLSCPS